LFLGRQRLEFAVKVLGYRFLAQQVGHAAWDVVELGAGMSSAHDGRDLVQAGAEAVEVALPRL
jgi:hypothetical protein